MTETTELSPAVDTSSAAESTAAPAKSSGLAGLKLAQLQALASQLGISGGSRMRKGDLVTAISAHRAGTPVSKAPARAAEKASDNGTVSHAAAPAAAPATAPAADDAPAQENPRARRGRSRRAGSDGVVTAPVVEAPAAAPAEAPAVSTDVRRLRHCRIRFRRFRDRRQRPHQAAAHPQPPPRRSRSPGHRGRPDAVEAQAEQPAAWQRTSSANSA